ncbi:hypothetical protein FNV43_RR06738 [Rhamnella rubrinervis]|uniref:Uncharacterized protein n=1 Tax=Rhamnella rubrinervis TaxID=2594499 RepID=A0A8K0MLP6_9ROSA|nr:hypothetical protein FNV43_RR06738 [Rhamnella rubrinervis]
MDSSLVIHNNGMRVKGCFGCLIPLSWHALLSNLFACNRCPDMKNAIFDPNWLHFTFHDRSIDVAFFGIMLHVLLEHFPRAHLSTPIRLFHSIVGNHSACTNLPSSLIHLTIWKLLCSSGGMTSLTSSKTLTMSLISTQSVRRLSYRAAMCLIPFKLLLKLNGGESFGVGLGFDMVGIMHASLHDAHQL